MLLRNWYDINWIKLIFHETSSNMIFLCVRNWAFFHLVLVGSSVISERESHQLVSRVALPVTVLRCQRRDVWKSTMASKTGTRICMNISDSRSWNDRYIYTTQLNMGEHSLETVGFLLFGPLFWDKFICLYVQYMYIYIHVRTMCIYIYIYMYTYIFVHISIWALPYASTTPNRTVVYWDHIEFPFV